MRGVTWMVAILGIGLLEAACAVTYVDGRVAHRGFGLVQVTPPAASEDPQVSRAVVVSTLGLSIYSDPASGSGLALGYGRQTFITLGANACLDLKAAGACAELAHNTRGAAP